ncbi:AAA domain-containing protein [Fusarium denticulatum]|uniref:AAA domain-containing protein n=1 Tax=Fusarium denticulatum TaxID=48507 RepID=A0A8H5TMY0_9HYPO|nr:AAA domain-containing protein [Fusarium denticulatum]
MRLRGIDVLQTTSTIRFRIGLTSHRLVWVRTTLSEYPKRLARENPAEWNGYLDAYRQKITDPETFILNRVGNEQHARELLIYAVSLTAVLGCTPVTFDQIKNHTGLEYNFIVLDEAAGMPESLSLIPMAKCPEASFLFIGDNKQFGPVVTALDRKDWQLFFGPQRTTSLFERIEKSGALLFRLKSKYRAHGKACLELWTDQKLRT